MSLAFNLSISSIPLNFNVAVLDTFVIHLLSLNGLTPLSKVLLTQTQQAPQNLHQFQVLTADARQWVDLLEGEIGLTIPGMIRISNGQAFTADEWQTIQQLRLDIFTLHNALGEPALIQVSFASPITTLSAVPTTAVHGASNAFTVGWHNAQAGHTDWISMFKVGDPNMSYGQYFVVPDFQTDGSFVFNAPATPGTYEFRYLVANSYVDVARSAPVTVT